MSIYSDIKERLDMKDVLTAYGIEVNRSGFCLCPFHGEKTPSMKVYEKNYKCFGCGESGDVIKFVEKMFNLSSIDACKKLNNDFSLGLHTSRPQRSEISQTMLLHQRRERMKEIENSSFNLVSDYLKTLNGYRVDYMPQNVNEVPDIRFIEHLTHFEQTSILYQEMIDVMNKPLEEKELFYEENKKSLISVFDKLENAKNTKQHEEEKNREFSDGEIIGNTNYRDISDRAYLKYTTAVAPIIATALINSGIRFSGKVYAKLTTFTVSRNDLQRVRNIANEINNQRKADVSKDVEQKIDINEIGENVTAITKEVLSEIENMVKAERTAIIDRSKLDEYNNDKQRNMPVKSTGQIELSDSENTDRENLHIRQSDVSLLSAHQQADRLDNDNVGGISETTGNSERTRTAGSTVLNEEKENSPTANWKRKKFHLPLVM